MFENAEDIPKLGEFRCLQPLDAPQGRAGDDPAARRGIRIGPPKYVVVLRQAKSADEARIAEGELRRKLPAARAVRADSAYFVVLDAAPAGESDALVAAARAKSATGGAVQPLLVKVQR